MSPTRFNVRALRDACGFSQADLADHMGVAERSISRWESGDASPSPMALAHLRRIKRQYQDKDQKPQPASVSTMTSRETPTPVHRGGLLPSMAKGA